MAELPSGTYEYLSRNSSLFAKSLPGTYFRFVNLPPHQVNPYHFTDHSRFGTPDIRTMAISKEIKAALYELGKKDILADPNNWTIQVYEVNESIFLDLREVNHEGLYDALYQPHNDTNDNDRWSAGRQVLTQLYSGGPPLLAGIKPEDLAGVCGISVSGSTHAAMTGTTNLYMNERHERRETTFRRIYQNSISGLIDEATDANRHLVSHLDEIKRVIAEY